MVRKPKTHPLTKRHRGYQPSSGLWDIRFINGCVLVIFSQIQTHCLQTDCLGEYSFDIKPSGITYSKFSFRPWDLLGKKIWVYQVDPEWLCGQIQSPSPAWHTEFQVSQKGKMLEDVGGESEWFGILIICNRHYGNGPVITDRSKRIRHFSTQKHGLYTVTYIYNHM